MYRFLLSPKWVASFLLCVLAGLVCVRLAHWQLDRLDEKRAINDTISAAREAPPAPADQVLNKPGDRPDYSRVTATGQYDSAGELLVRNRPLDNNHGFYVLTPLRTTDGPVLWVVRGWIEAPPGGATMLPTYGDPPSGTVTVLGRIRAPESGSTGAIELNGTNLITRITSEALRSGGPAYDAFVELVEPIDEESGLSPLPAPTGLDDGPHLAYAVQWYLFGGMFLVGYVILARNYAHRDDDPRAAVGGSADRLVDAGPPGKSGEVTDQAVGAP